MKGEWTYLRAEYSKKKKKQRQREVSGSGATEPDADAISWVHYRVCILVPPAAGMLWFRLWSS